MSDASAAPHRVIELANDWADFSRIADAVSEFGAELHLRSDTIFELRLVLDELVGNVLRHGCDPTRRHRITVRLAVAANEVMVEIEDDGRAFDPLSCADPDLSLSIDQRPAGGLGMYFVRKLMADLRYQRLGDRNLLAGRMRRE